VARTVVVIPTYNERENIQRIVPQILAATPCEIVVVDDESPDGTAAVVAAMGASDPRVHLVNHRPKMGIGPAYKAGFEHALALGADYVVQMDADLSHPPEMLPRFVEMVTGGADLVLGSRYIRGITVVNWPIERLLLSYFGNWYARRVTGLPIRDATGGFKCWRREAPTVPPLASYRQDHRRVALRLRIQPTTARWIEIRVPALAPNAWSYTDGTWGIHELRVYGPPSGGAETR
jgi:dolichol-phosphate mannosyltransferase